MDESLVYIVWRLASVKSSIPLREPSEACICEDWVGIFIFLKHLLFCSVVVPAGTIALIFLEGMFRKPPSPRGKDNGGCDVTSILGREWSGGRGEGKILGGLDEFWNASSPRNFTLLRAPHRPTRERL